MLIKKQQAMSYAVIIKKLRVNIDVEQLGVKWCNVRVTRRSDVILIINWGDTAKMIVALNKNDRTGRYTFKCGGKKL